ncbi:Ig-like domain-containing protein, partial [Planococcus wigleyi]
AEITDDVSGVNYAIANFESPSGDRSISIQLRLNSSSGLYEGKHLVTTNDEGGLWQLSYINVSDNVSSRKNYYPKDFPNPLEFTILNGNGDSAAPVVHSLEVSPDKVSVGEEIIVKAEITDDVSGVNYAIANFESPSGDRSISIHLRLNSSSGLYEGKHLVTTNDEEGLWQLSYINVGDNVSSRKNYYPRDFVETSKLNFIISSSPSDLEKISINDPTLPYAIITKNEVLFEKLIKKDLYVGPNSTITIAEDVTITGNVYVYGTLISHGGLTIQGSLNAKAVTYGSNSTVSPGAVRLVGGQNTIRSTVVSNQPYEVPFSVDNEDLTNEKGTIEITGKTLPFLDVSLQGSPISLEEDGSFAATAEGVTSKGIQFNLIDVFGNDIKKDIAVKDVVPPADVSGFTVSKETHNEIQVAWKSGTDTDLKEYALYSNGKLITTLPADLTSYKFEKLNEGTSYELAIAAVDTSNNTSNLVKVTATTSLSKPIVNPVSDKSTSVTGQAAPGTTVSIQNGEAVSGSGKTDAAGEFNIKIPTQKAGTKLTVFVSNEAGIVSEKVTITVEDKTAPILSTLAEVTDKSTIVKGAAEAGSVIAVKVAGVEIGKGTTNKDGNFAVTIAKQKAGTKLSVTATDTAGNVSSAKVTTVMDVTAPSTPSVNKVTEQSTAITGTAEAAAKIIIKVGNKEIGTATVSADGTYSVSIPKQSVGTVLSFTATDKAGNVSSVKEIVVVDGTPPAISLTSKVTHHSTRVIGTAEADAKITVKAGTKSIGTATANAKGHYEATIAKQKVGTRLSIVATDAAGNSSNAIAVTVVDGNYPDLKLTHWALDEIMYLADDQIIGGYPNGGFQPEKNTTRAEAAKMLALALDLPIVETSSGYKDVSGKHWAKDYIAAVSKAGLFNGNPDGTFAPNDVLKRAEMAKVISIAYDLNSSNKNHFNDVKAGHWAKGYISGLYENGITTGFPDKTFRPGASTTRAEYSVFLARALNEDFR